MRESIYYQLFFQEIEEAIIAQRYDFKGFGDDQLSEGQRIENWPIDATIIVKGKNPPDNLFCPMKPWFVVSKKVTNVLIEKNTKGIQLLPVRILHLSGIEIPGYSILNVLEMVKGLHYEKTTWLTPNKWNVEYPQLDIVKEALIEEVVREKDIFRIIEQKTTVYISKILKGLLEKRGADIGFKFLPVKAFSKN